MGASGSNRANSSVSLLTRQANGPPHLEAYSFHRGATSRRQRSSVQGLIDAAAGGMRPRAAAVAGTGIVGVHAAIEVVRQAWQLVGQA